MENKLPPTKIKKKTESIFLVRITNSIVVILSYLCPNIYFSENGVLAICQLDTHDAVVGFIAARDYPLLPSVHPLAWEEYIWAKYKYITTFVLLSSR